MTPSMHTWATGPACEREVLVLGFVRPEIRFSGVEALIARIRTDTAIARVQLDAPELQPAAAALEVEVEAAAAEN
ncbi:hypothetical protein PLESTF_001111400 [Pleodorina starrii]|nr:hypothetical protein PLESTM_001806900 [Pleodorina starrii]GLC45962.1 hypothetical protein PLESTM_001807100 [Pleodorina starrii]GLC71399.1 hypothetical protein PLESTF_001111200 [Pleodorina starrii]GLC71401.1 hypothetical protein PLESTF_001111400 [Pleodorina starrii]